MTIFIAPFSASFYILNMWVLHILRLFLVKYCFFNHLEETFKLFVNLLISPCQILQTADWTYQTKSFAIVHKYFIYIYIQFFLTNHACEERLCNIVPCISENWWHWDIFYTCMNSMYTLIAELCKKSLI